MRVLREVGEQGSFSAAADELHLTQSAVSQQVAALERETGSTLVQRNSKGVVLTDAGTTLVSHADAILARLEEAERELGEIAGLRAGRLRLVSFPTANATLVGRAIARFRKRHPEVKLGLAEAEPEDSIPRLRAGEHDIALVYDFEAVPLEESRDTDRVLLLSERMQVALPEDHRLARRKAVRLEELAKETWICGVRPCSCRENVVKVCRTANFEPHIEFESDDYAVHQSLVAAGMGVALLPVRLVPDSPAGVVRVDIAGEEPVRRVWALTLPAEMRSPATDAMLEVLRTVADGFGERSAKPRRSRQATAA